MDYALLCGQARELSQAEGWYPALFANAAALLWETLPDINWAGFYIARRGQLVLGPFQGKAACIHIPRGKGVCGAALRENRTVLVPNVHAFPGHIACDSASNAEIVIPLRRRDGGVAAVLNEIAVASDCGILIDEDALPIHEEVQGVCDILGFDPLYLANEGKCVAFVPADEAQGVLSVMQANKYGRDARIIGEVTETAKGQVGLRTAIGGIRVVDMPLGNLVPRIC